MITTVYHAKTHLSELLHAAEEGDDIIIQRGKKGPMFKIVPVKPPPLRTMEPLPEWKINTQYTDADLLMPEWEEDEA